MISDAKYQQEATRLNVKVSRIKAVAEVESSCNGFLNGKPVICFEPHIFWKQLQKLGIDPLIYATKEHPVQDLSGNVTGSTTKLDPYWGDVLYPTWGEKPYPWGQENRYKQLDKAAQINRDAALKSASWGKFQIMAFNYKACGCSSLQEFINKIYKSEDDHLDLFVSYVQTNGLAADLRAGNWARFADSYNGPSYKRNHYDTNLAAADLKWSK
jgi:hypothetical protein